MNGRTELIDRVKLGEEWQDFEFKIKSPKNFSKEFVFFLKSYDEGVFALDELKISYIK